MNKLVYAKFSVLLAASLIIFSTSLFAGTKGKISGKVLDDNGEPLIGVQVVIDGTTKGVLTDLDGNYSIVNLDPGTYTVVFNYIGFATTRVEQVVVIVDKTTEVNVTMSEEVIEGQEIVVTAERPIVEKDRTTTTAYVSAEQLEELPVVSINDAIEQQAGVDNGHFRGGRQGEVSYLVNGVPINNAFDNSASFEIEQNMVSSLEVISGVFNAEYGQALSGVVNIVTKGVSDKWTASFLGYSGTIVSNRELEFVRRNVGPGAFLSASDFSQEKVSYTEASSNFANWDIQFTAGGPVIKDKLGVRATIRYIKDPGYLVGRDLFRPDDIQFGVNAGGDQSTWLLESTGSGDFEELNNSLRQSANIALVYEINSRLKVDYNLFLQDQEGGGYNHSYKYNPNGLNQGYNFTQNHILGIRYTMGQNAFANFSYSYLSDRGESYLYSRATETELDSRYVASELSSQQGQDAFNMGGNDLFSSQGITSSHTIVTDYTSQINNIVLFKTGLSARFHSLDNESFGIIRNNATGEIIRATNDLGNSFLDVNPYEAAGYSQVKLEFENLIVNAGLRFDYFEPDYVVPVDVTQATEAEIPDPNDPNVLISNRTAADPSFQLSPRLGIAFPISETGVMRFSAGLFYQTPRLDRLYTNHEFEAGEGASQVSYGNAGLRPERTLQFEVGLQQGLTESLGMDLTIFSKDIRDLAGTEVGLDARGRQFSRLINLDYGTIKGATLSLYQRGLGAVSWTLDYTLQFANGSASDPNVTFQRFLAGVDPIIKIDRLNWDKRHIVNNTITIDTKFGLTLSAINSLQTGSPYTSVRDFIQSSVPNNEDTPLWFNSDARVYYKPSVITQDIQLFLQVDNIFDYAPHWNVFSDTGLADESTELGRRLEGTSTPGGLSSYEEFFLGEDRLGPPRTIKLGLSVKF